MKRNERVTGVLLSYMNLVLRNLASVLLIPLIIVSAGDAQYGVYSLVASIIGYLVIIELGLANTVIRFLSKYTATNEADRESVFLGNIFTLYGFIILLVNILGYLIYSNIHIIFERSFSETEIQLLKDLFIILLLNITFTLFGNSFTGIIISKERFIFLKTLDFTLFIVRTSCAVLLLILNYSVVAIAILDTLINLTLLTIKVFFVLIKLQVRVKIKYEFYLFKEILTYGSFIALNVIVNQINWRVDYFIVGYLLGPIDVAIFSVSNQFLLSFIAIASAIANVFLPKIVKLVAGNATALQLSQELHKVGRIQLLVLYAFLVVYFAVGRQLISLLFGENYTSSFYMSLIVMVPVLLVLALSTSNSILQAKNMHKFKSILLLCIAFANVILTFYMVEHIGIFGAPIITAFTLFIGEVFLVSIYLTKRVGLNLIDFFKSYTHISLLILIYMLLIYFIIPVNVSVFNIIVYGTATLLIYVFFVWFYFMNQYEKLLVKSIVNKLKSKLSRY